jgi:lipopolysaccharide biosynthesis protein
MILQTSGNSSSRGIIQSALGNVPVKLAGPLRRMGSVFTRFMNHWRAHARPSTRPAPGNTFLDAKESARPLVSSAAHEDLNVPETSIAEKALSQIYARTGVDAWQGYVHRAHDSVLSGRLQVKAIAIYVPEFYGPRGEVESSDISITPWTNISEALPRYLGQYQPHRPGELGFYDQRLPAIMRQQVDLAKQYGIHGFCFHYYWSEGRNSRGLPLIQFLSDASLDMQFCICWKNELQPQSKEDSARIVRDSCANESGLIDSLESVFSDPRYIRVDGRPLLIVYRPAILPDALAIGRRWRNRVKQMGYPDLYLVGSRADEDANPHPIEFDGSVEYPPHDTAVTEITSQYSLIDRNFSGHVYNYQEVAEAHVGMPKQPNVNFRSVMTSWDDESKRPGAGVSFAGSTPALYAQWLDRSCRMTMMRRPEERFVFINAWNNWADGAHLEPDRKFGYAYLQATANVLRLYQDVAQTIELIKTINAKFAVRSQTAIIFHCHYEDLIRPILERYLARLEGVDVFVTVHPDFSVDAIEQIGKNIPNVYFLCLENRGRDIRSFMLALRHIRSLGYLVACKIHTKKTPQAVKGFGDSWRQKLIDPLLGSSKSLTTALERFENESDLGILVPDGSLIDLSLPDNHVPNTYWLDRILQRMNRSDLIQNYSIRFSAGSMFWFRIEALAGLDDLILAGDDFELELGQRDGTLAHAVERLVTLYAQERGFCTKEISETAQK